MILGLLVVTLVLFGIPLWMVGIYNRLVSLRNLNADAWAQTDVQLRRRYDLIPNLVATVKGYATHEQETFQNVNQARNAAMNATEPQAKGSAERVLTGALRSVIAVAEAYPELKADQSFTMLQEELTSTEGFIAECRSHYNDSVMTYNTSLETFPVNIVAEMFKFQPGEYFGTTDAASREPAKVAF